MTTAIPGLGALAARYEDITAARPSSEDDYRRLSAILIEIGAVLETSGVDQTVRQLALGFLLGVRHPYAPDHAATIIYSLGASPLDAPDTNERYRVEARYRAIAALTGEACDPKRLPSWLTPSMSERRAQAGKGGAGADGIARALRGVAAGFSAYNGEFMTGSRNGYEILASILAAAREVMTPNDYADEAPILLTIGCWLGTRYDHSPESAASLMALFLDPKAERQQVAALYHLLCALTLQEPDEYDLPYWLGEPKSR